MMSKALERWAVVGDGTKESRRLIPMKDDGRDPVELYDALQQTPSIKISDGDVWLIFPEATN